MFKRIAALLAVVGAAGSRNGRGSLPPALNAIRADLHVNPAHGQNVYQFVMVATA
jgi:hypothetical protein